MPKFYVSSGPVRRIISRPTIIEAARDTLGALDPPTKRLLGETIRVSEHGFDLDWQDDRYLPTATLFRTQGS